MANSIKCVLVLYVYRLKNEGLLPLGMESVTWISMTKALLVEAKACIYLNESRIHTHTVYSIYKCSKEVRA